MGIEIKEGIELDAAIAEIVFGPWCTVTMCATSGCRDLPLPNDGSDPDVLAVWSHPDHHREWWSCPKFSKNTDDALDAAERSGLLRGVFDLFRTPDSGWCVLTSIYESSDLPKKYPTPALAICAKILEMNGDL